MANRYWDRELKEWVWAEYIEVPRNVSLGGETGDVVWGRAGEWEVERGDGSRQVYGARTFEERCRLEAPNYVEVIDLTESEDELPYYMLTAHLPAKAAVRPAVLEVERERVRQDERWGEGNHDPYYWYTILGEEFGGVGKALCEIPFGKLDWQDYREELIHLAAVAVSMVESLDRGNNATAQRAADDDHSATTARTSAVGAGDGVPGV